MFEKDGFVYKLYDTKTESPNLALAQLVLPKAELTALTVEGHYKSLKTLACCIFLNLPFFSKTCKKAMTKGLFILISDLIHSNGKAAKLIDFDLAASCGTPPFYCPI